MPWCRWPLHLIALSNSSERARAGVYACCASIDYTSKRSILLLRYYPRHSRACLPYCLIVGSSPRQNCQLLASTIFPWSFDSLQTRHHACSRQHSEYLLATLLCRNRFDSIISQGQTSNLKSASTRLSYFQWMYSESEIASLMTHFCVSTYSSWWSCPCW